MSDTPRNTKEYRVVLISGVITMTAGLVMLIVGVFTNKEAVPLFGFLIPAGGFFTLLGLRARAKALGDSESGSKKTSDTPKQ